MKVPCPICGEPWIYGLHESGEAREACDAKMKAWRPTGILKTPVAFSICSEAELRSKMTDDEFWSHVFAYREGTQPDIDPPEPDDASEIETECSECGAAGACAYDSEGRPMIHATGYRNE